MNMEQIKLKINGMHCKSCKMLIEDVMEDLNSKVISFDVDDVKQIGILEIKSDASFDSLKYAIEKEGEYEVSKV